MSRWGVFALLTVAACGGSTAATAVRPPDPTYAEASGAPACRAVDDYPAPLAVDWRPEDRVDLEAAMHKGVAVVAYDCKSIRLLPTCTVPGSYGFVGTSTEQQVVRLENTDELTTNLPRFGAALGVKLDTELRRGATLDVALMMIGKEVATRAEALPEELQGDCAGATHFVLGTTVGAFAMRKGTRATVRSAAELLGAASETTSTSSKEVESAAGSLDDCNKALPFSPAPEGRCSAPLRLQLRRIGKVPPLEGALARSWCPQGMILTAGKCALPASTEPQLCVYGDAADCQAQCDRGDSGSCANMGLMFFVGRGVKTDTLRASSLFQTACEKGNGPACGRLGAMFLAGSGPAADETRGRELLTRACTGGWMEACWRLGELGRRSPTSGINVLALFDRACRGGDGEGCASLGTVLDQGIAGPPDRDKAFALFKQGCDLGSARACTLYGSAFEHARGTPMDVPHAAALYGKACDAGFADGCNRLSTLYFEGRNGVGQDPARGIELLKKACKLGQGGACVVLALRMKAGMGLPKDEAGARELLRTTCAAGEKLACEMLEGPMGPYQE
jgi:TPR repeat protein